MANLNCWEFRKCGREPGGKRVEELGPCPAATETRADGVNGGKNGGRTCWAICGTMCGGNVLGTYAAKIGCRSCEFFQSVQRDIEGRAFSPRDHPMKVLDIVLERTVILEREIEHRMQAEEALRQANAKLNLLSDITRHDMLNKLNAIGLISNLIGKKNPDDPGLAAALSNLDSQVQALTEMVLFTRDYQELGSHCPQWQELGTVIRGVMDKKIPVEISVAFPAGEYEVCADPLLGRAFYNLLDNAVRHGQTVSRITIRGMPIDAGFSLVWEDDGTGIPTEEKERIFLKGYGKNTGLGLFLVREILATTGISIRESGEPGKGARFELVFPESMVRVREGPRPR